MSRDASSCEYEKITADIAKICGINVNLAWIELKLYHTTGKENKYPYIKLWTVTFNSSITSVGLNSTENYTQTPKCVECNGVIDLSFSNRVWYLGKIYESPTTTFFISLTHSNLVDHGHERAKHSWTTVNHFFYLFRLANTRLLIYLWRYILKIHIIYGFLSVTSMTICWIPFSNSTTLNYRTLHSFSKLLARPSLGITSWNAEWHKIVYQEERFNFFYYHYLVGYIVLIPQHRWGS